MIATCYTQGAPPKPKSEQAASPVINPGREVAGANPVGGAT